MTDVTADRGSGFRVGKVLSRAWRVLGPNFLLFICITLVVSLPNSLYLTRDPRLPGYLSLFFAGAFLVVLLNTVGQAVLLFASFQQLRGEPVRIGEAFRRGFTRFFPLVGLGILSSLGIAFGSLLLLVPGLFLMTMWMVAVPACVVEGAGPISALSRSSKLTKGHRWQIFGIIVLLSIVNIVGAKLLGLILTPAGLAVKAVGIIVWGAIWTAYWNCTLIMTYHDLRVAKEGIDTEQIAAVFD